jgi:2-C-methyl-D-erythritol 4-phosphate cytidylyltransferase
MQMSAWGFVPVSGRGALPFALVHGESLVAAASFALEAAGVELLDPQLPWERVRDSGRALVLHDAACPLTPVPFLAAMAERAAATGSICVAHRPVTDTVKTWDAAAAPNTGMVGDTVDRATLVEVTSPIVLPASVVGALERLPVDTFAALVDELRLRWPVELVEAPATGRRVHSADEVGVLEALSASR